MRVAVLLLVALPAAALAADVSGRVRVTEGGRPKDAQGVLVYVMGFEEPPPAAVPELQQKGRQFHPPVLAITAGQSVSFPNTDSLFHNVFSLSPARRFDLGQFKAGETKVKDFPRPGIVEVYCNIHPEMAATIVVLPNRRFTMTGKDGRFRLAGVPSGSWTIFAYDRLAEKPARADVVVPASGAPPEVTFDIEETRTLEHPNKYGEAYSLRP